MVGNWVFYNLEQSFARVYSSYSQLFDDLSHQIVELNFGPGNLLDELDGTRMLGSTSMSTLSMVCMYTFRSPALFKGLSRMARRHR